MKSKVILLLLGVCSFTSALSQIDSIKSNKQNHKYKWACAVAINSVEAQIGKPEESSWGYVSHFFSSSLLWSDKKDMSISLSAVPKYYVNDNILLRIEFGMTNIKISSIYDAKGNSTRIIEDVSVQQRIHRYIPGIQWNFIRHKRIYLYGGITASYISYGTLFFDSYTQWRDPVNDTVTFTLDDHLVADGGFAAGIGSLMGFHIYLQDHFSIGAEFSSSLLYYNLGGEFTDITDPPSSTPVFISSSSYKGIQFSKILSSFNISVWF